MCDPIGMDETRMRTTNLLCKVFLQHLNPLLTLNTFTALWLTILDFMDKYIKADMKNELVVSLFIVNYPIFYLNLKKFIERSHSRIIEKYVACDEYSRLF